MGFLEDVLAQPDNLAESRAIVLEALAGHRLLDEEGGPILFVGMGASGCATAVAAALCEQGRAALAYDAAELTAGVAALAGTTVAVSATGRSPETVAVASSARRCVGVCNDTASPLAAAADVLVPLGSRAESGLSTLTYTATVQALGLLASRRGDGVRDWARLPGEAASLLGTADAAMRDVAERWAGSGVSAVDVVGHGVGRWSAEAAALLLREATWLPAAAYDTFAYLHGPVEAAERGLGCVVFGAERELALARDLASYGADVLLLTTGDVAPAEGLAVVRLPALPAPACAVPHILPVQLLAYRLATARGVPVETFRRRQPDTKVGDGLSGRG